MRRVIIESPLSGDFDANVLYARRCLLDSLNRGEAPLASHLLYPQVLDDNLSQERELGIMAGLVWGQCADATVVYTDRGISHGMKVGIDTAKLQHRLIEFRSLGSD